MLEFFKYFTQAQIDYIYFFYGLAFLLLGTLCLLPRSTRKHNPPWKWIGYFGLLHGYCEWMDLVAFNVADNALFQNFRIVCNLTSFLFLIEFGRAGENYLNGKAPGKWIYLPLLGTIFTGAFISGLPGVGILSRYAACFVGATWTASVIFRLSRSAPFGKRSLAAFAAIFFAYAIAAGIVTPANFFFPANIINHITFFNATGIPVQMVRGLLAIAAAISFWHYYLGMLQHDGNLPQSELINKFANRMAGTILILLFAGWIFTDRLGIYGGEQDMMEHETIHKIRVEELNQIIHTANQTVRCLAESGTITNTTSETISQTNKTLDRYSRILDGSICYMLDSRGTTIASSNRNAPQQSFVGQDFSKRKYYREAMQGKNSQSLVVGSVTREPGYYASCPIRGKDNTITGAVVIKVSLARHDTFLHAREYTFLLDPDGVIFISNIQELRFHPLVPSTPERIQEISHKGIYLNFHKEPVFKTPLLPGIPYSFQGKNVYYFTSSISMPGWSLVDLEPLNSIKTFRFIGIIITLVIAMAEILFFIIRQKDLETMERIKASENFLSQLINAIPNPVYYKDVNGKYLGINHSFCAEIARQPRENIIGHTVAELSQFPPETIQEVQHQDTLALSSRGIQVYEHNLATPNGKNRIYLTTKKAFFDSTGAIGGLVGIMVDITPLKEAEAQRNKLQEELWKTQKSDSLSVMATSIAHSFNNIFTTVLGFQEMALYELPENTSSHNLIKQAQQAAQEAAKMSSLMQLYVGQSITSLQETDLVKCVKTALPPIIAKDLPEHITVKLNETHPSLITMADQQMIQSLFKNLMKNAMEAIEPELGEINIALSRMDCTEEYLAKAIMADGCLPGPYVYLEVADSGCGMDTATLSKIFDPFFTTKFTGRGLGLPTVMGIVRQHKGAIVIQTSLGTGSSFRVLFPDLTQEMKKE